jgi:hypothetical protein
MARDSKPAKRGLGARVGGWFSSFSGILASLATIVAAVAGLIAGHQTTVVHQQNQTIVKLSIQNHRLRSARASDGGSSAPAPSTGSSGGATITSGEYLSTQQPTVANADYQNGSQTLSAKPYPDSIMFYCEGYYSQDHPDMAYDVAGNSLFTAVVGIPDNSANATGLAETVIFATQSGRELGKPVVVSLGSPAKVSLNITGVTQLQVTCTGVDQSSHQQANGNELALGNASVS